MRTPSLLACAALTAALSAQAAVFVEAPRTYQVGADLADLQNPPLVFQQKVTDSPIVELTEVRVGLHLVGRGTGGFAGEVFVSLNKDLGATAVLLNRVGAGTGAPVGFSYDGWQVNFADGAAGGDIHMAALGTGVLTGTFAPDGRLAPADTLRPALLASLLGGTGNGDWRLNVADLDLGGTLRLESWTLTLSGFTAVPEHAHMAALTTAALASFAAWRRARRAAGE